MTKTQLRRLSKRIGRDLKWARRIYGINQGELAKEIGLIQSAISRIEDGHQQISAAEAVAIRHWLQSRPNMFLNNLSILEGGENERHA